MNLLGIPTDMKAEIKQNILRDVEDKIPKININSILTHAINVNTAFSQAACVLSLHFSVHKEHLPLGILICLHASF